MMILRLKLVLPCIFTICKHRAPNSFSKSSSKELDTGGFKDISPSKLNTTCNQTNVNIEPITDNLRKELDQKPENSKRGNEAPIEEEKELELVMVENYKMGQDELYTGTLEDSKRCGEGTLTWSNGDKYTGGWKDDLFDGYGILSKANGDTYKGNWTKGRLNGTGKVRLSDGYFLEAVFVDNEAEGRGKEVSADGIIYEGEFRRNKKHGKGKMKWPSGKVYEGDFFENAFHGKGILIKDSGNYYDGTYCLNH
eukprot:TRINITY_DN13113_c0_g1_i13.p1 TRINITY_DN13113_c0_g1~~TRINITY_DN13113_c0_g1_i13.p1  ORF type:complete len:252 (-),score=52.67 TRINITY_DN13113_c0_g1_i13:338-1093(-)